MTSHFVSRPLYASIQATTIVQFQLKIFNLLGIKQSSIMNLLKVCSMLQLGLRQEHRLPSASEVRIVYSCLPDRHSGVLSVLEKSVFTRGYRQITRDMTSQWRDNGMTSLLSSQW